MSLGETAWGRSVRGWKCPVGKCPWMEISGGKFPGGSVQGRSDRLPFHSIGYHKDSSIHTTQ